MHLLKAVHPVEGEGLSFLLKKKCGFVGKKKRKEKAETDSRECK